MFDQDAMKRLLEELGRLNGNLETMHQDAGELRTLNENIRLLMSRMKDVSEKFRGMGALVKQIALLNQIMLSTRKAAGTSGMIQSIISGIVRMAGTGK